MLMRAIIMKLMAMTIILSLWQMVVFIVVSETAWVAFAADGSILISETARLQIGSLKTC